MVALFELKSIAQYTEGQNSNTLENCCLLPWGQPSSEGHVLGISVASPHEFNTLIIYTISKRRAPLERDPGYQLPFTRSPETCPREIPHENLPAVSHTAFLLIQNKDE